MGYLVEAIRKDYETLYEDRLSQVFTASFNHSEIFRKLFLKFIGYPFTKTLYALTQRSFNSGGKSVRIDVCIFDKQEKESPVVIIENKIEAPFTLKQLKTYNRVRQLARAQKVALVKHYFDPLPEEVGWKVYHWTDLHERCLDIIKKVEKKQIDSFIIQNFLDYLEELQMSKVRLIKGADLKELAKAIHKIRNVDEPYFHLNKSISVFQTANDYLTMLEQIVDMARQEKLITKRIGRSFRFSPWIGSWWKDEEKTKANVWIGVELDLSKKFKKISSIGTGIEFNDLAEDDCKIVINAYQDDFTCLHEVKYKDVDLSFENYKDQVINSWKKWLR